MTTDVFLSRTSPAKLCNIIHTNLYSLGKLLIYKKGGIMPNKDGTGPQGKGSRTGRGDGNCKPAQQGDNIGNGRGKGGGGGRGAGGGKGLGKQNRNRGK